MKARDILDKINWTCENELVEEESESLKEETASDAEVDSELARIRNLAGIREKPKHPKTRK